MNWLEASGNGTEMSELRLGISYGPANSTLLDRVPTTDEYGKPLGDMIVLLPRLREKTAHEVTLIARGIDRALSQFSAQIMFAELNVNRNNLWVSMRPTKGIRAYIATAIRLEVPDAKLIGHL